MENRDDRTINNIFYWIVILLLIIIILLLLFRSNVGVIDNGNNCQKPSREADIRNIDIFDININGICEKPSQDPTKPGGSSGGQTKTDYPVWNKEEVEENEYGQIYVYDKDGQYAYHQQLDIFSNPFYEYESKIAPGVSNTYSFVVRNDSNASASYAIEMYKTCDYDINLTYRLKKNGEYVIGDDNNWVTAEQLKTEFSRLSSNNNDSYMLDWKWEYEAGRDDVDTYIGENMTDEYKLSIIFYVEQA